jgi:hypothetical protein
MMEVLTIWLKIIGIIALWELWKWIGWELVNWWVTKQAKRYEKGKRVKNS